MLATQEHCNICIAVSTVRSSRPAAIDYRASHAVTTAQQGEKAPDGFLGIMVNLSREFKK